MKLCFSTLGCTDYSLDEVLALAKGYRIGAVEIRGLGGQMDNAKIDALSEENTEQTVRRLNEAGVCPAVLGTSVSFHKKGGLDDALAEGINALKIAERIGFMGVRVFGNVIEGDDGECVGRVIDGLRRLCDYAMQTNVYILLETHGEFNTGSRIGAIVDALGEHPRFGLLWDICHTRNTFASQKDFYDRFAPYIKHVHIKDIKGDALCAIGDGDLPINEIINMMEKGGYDGYFSLEWEQKWHPELAPLESALTDFVRLIRGEKIKQVIFDMDGTLVDSLCFWGYLWSEIGRKYKNDASFLPVPEADAAVRTMLYDESMRYIHDLYFKEVDRQEFLDYTESFLPDFYKNVATIKPGARELIAYLKSKGIGVRLATATSRRYIQGALVAVGLEGEFDHIVSCSEIGFGKERPDVFFKAIEGLGVSVYESLVVEDSATALKSARDAGFNTVGVFDTYAPLPDKVKEYSKIYLGEGHTLAELIGKI